MIVDSNAIKLSYEKKTKNANKKKILPKSGLQKLTTETQNSEDSGSGRSRRQSPLIEELRKLDIESPRIVAELTSSARSHETSNNSSSFDIFRDRINDNGSNEENDEFIEFLPKIGFFGAPMCRWTNSVMALVGMMFGIVLATSGACILVFFVDEEPTVYPLGVTLGIVGTLLSLLGAIMWMSEFMCNDCLSKAHKKIKDAPIKNAIKRRSRMASRISGNSIAKMVDSRASSKLSDVSFRSPGNSRTAVSMKY